MHRFSALQVIECLRSGVSSRHLSSIFSYGREAVMERVERDLSRIQTGGGTIPLVIKGNFGNGKTHFLNIIAQLAEKMNFAVSFVPLSKETPFDKLDRLYRRVATGLYLPGYSQPGFAPLLDGLMPGSEDAEEILRHVGQNLHPKLEAVLRNYVEGGGDAYNQHILISDLAGDFVPITQLKSIHRLNFGKALTVPRFVVKENAFDYFRFLSYLIRARGYSGWVILFDEFEQLMYLGITARANAYINAARFISPSYGLTATYTTFSASSNLWTELIWKQKKSDYDAVPEKLEARGRQHEIPTVREVFSYFLRDNLFLDNLSTFDIRRMLQAIRNHHAAAYNWPAPEDIDQITGHMRGDRPLRTVIRALVEHLDLQYLYSEKPQITVRMLEEILPDEEVVNEEENLACSTGV